MLPLHFPSPEMVLFTVIFNQSSFEVLHINMFVWTRRKGLKSQLYYRDTPRHLPTLISLTGNKSGGKSSIRGLSDSWLCTYEKVCFQKGFKINVGSPKQTALFLSLGTNKFKWKTWNGIAHTEIWSRAELHTRHTADSDALERSMC